MAKKKALPRRTLPRRPEVADAPSIPRCGLCGKTKKLTKTECCDNWICDDEQSYVLFSYAQNSCSRNHRRYTLCGNHCTEGHSGRWQDCAQCRADSPTEMYVWYGTNDFNFEKLPNPPAYEPTLCSKCKRRITLPEGGYSQLGDEYLCSKCSAKEFGKIPGFNS